MTQETRLDAADSVFLDRELQSIKARVWARKRPPFGAFALFPQSYEADPGAETIVWRQTDQVGVARIVANSADDLPRVDVLDQENFSHIRTIGVSYAFTNQEIRAANLANKPLTARRAEAARRATDQRMNTIAFNGSKKDNLKGIFETANANIVVAGTAAAAPNGIAWSAASGKTADEILTDMFALVDTPNQATNGVERPNTMVLPIAAFNYISATPRSTQSDTTILEFFRRVRPGVAVMSMTEFDSVAVPPSGGAATSVAMAFVRSDEHVTMEIPMAFTQNAPQPRNLEQVVPCEARFGGVIVHLPLSIAFMEGV